MSEELFLARRWLPPELDHQPVEKPRGHAEFSSFKGCVLVVDLGITRDVVGEGKPDNLLDHVFEAGMEQTRPEFQPGPGKVLGIQQVIPGGFRPGQQVGITVAPQQTFGNWVGPPSLAPPAEDSKTVAGWLLGQIHPRKR